MPDITPQRKRAVERVLTYPRVVSYKEVAFDGWERAIVAEGLLRDAQGELAKAAAVAATPQSFDLEGCRQDFNQLYLRIRSFLSAEEE